MRNTIDKMADIYLKIQNGTATLSDRLEYDVLRGTYGWSKETADFIAQAQMRVNKAKEKKNNADIFRTTPACVERVYKS